VSKLLCVFSVIFLISACEPTQEQTNSKPLEELRCIGSQTECFVATKLANFSIKFSQYQLTDNIEAELPFTIELAVIDEDKDKQNVAKVSAHMEGRDMYMGKVPVFFKQNDNKSAYLAETMLASCSGGKMVWRLWITTEMAEQQQQFFVDFTSKG
jgi:hypothetical protein